MLQSFTALGRSDDAEQRKKRGWPNWHVSLVIRKWFSNSPDKYAGIVTSKYPFPRVNSLRIKQATEARSITLSLLSRMVQLIISQSSCSKAAKMFKKSAIFKHKKVSPSMPCVVEHVTSNSEKRSDAFHSTSENSENLNRWFLLNWKRPRFLSLGLFLFVVLICIQDYGLRRNIPYCY